MKLTKLNYIQKCVLLLCYGGGSPVLANSSTSLQSPWRDWNLNNTNGHGLVMMIPDGMGPNVFTMARTVKDTSLKTPLNLDELLLGSVQTRSKSSYVTDSSASATAYATGYKTVNTAVGVNGDMEPVGTILEAAKAKGMVTGMIVTSRVTHATPASFMAHGRDRDDEDDIALQYIENLQFDFLLGGGSQHFNATMLERVESKGYQILRDFADLKLYGDKHASSGYLRVLGLFHESHMSYDVDRRRKLKEEQKNHGSAGCREPSLAEMVDIILSLLENNKQAKENGFFVMIEGSRVDHAGHSNDPGTLASEAIAFDDTAAVVKEFIKKDRNKRALVSAADHGTGGMTLGKDSLYEWDPIVLQQQLMSTEGILQELNSFVQVSSNCKDMPTDAACLGDVLNRTKQLITSYTYVKTLNESMTSLLQSDVEDFMHGISGSLSHPPKLMTTLGHLVSHDAQIGWTTTGHVGTDVLLYCLGPLELERACIGSHDNTYINTILVNFLDLAEAQAHQTEKLQKNINKRQLTSSGATHQPRLRTMMYSIHN